MLYTQLYTLTLDFGGTRGASHTPRQETMNCSADTTFTWLLGELRQSWCRKNVDAADSEAAQLPHVQSFMKTSIKHMEPLFFVSHHQAIWVKMTKPMNSKSR